MSNDVRNEIAVGAAIIALAAFVTSVLGFRLSYRAFRQEHEHRRRRFTLDLIQQWDATTLQARSSLTRVQDLYFEDKAVIPFNRIIQARNAEIELVAKGALGGDWVLITDRATSLLNYMNWVALALELKLADEKTVKNDLSQAFRRWYIALREFRGHFEGPPVRQHRPWSSLDKLMDKWFGGQDKGSTYDELGG